MQTRILMAVFVTLALAAPAAAQSEWLAAEGTSIALEYRHPSLEFLDEDADASMINGAFFLSGRFGVPMVGIAGVVEVPFAYAKFGEGDFENSGTSLGNIYIGGELPIMLGAATVVGGVRVPTSPEFEIDDDNPSQFIGFLSSQPDRFDAFIPKAIVPQLGVRLGVPGIPIFDVEANLNANYLIYTADADEDTDNDFVLDGGVRGFANLLALRAGVGVEGFAELTGDDVAGDEEQFSERSAFQVGLWADYAIGILRPGVSFFIPVGGGDYHDTVDWLLGLSLELNLPM